MTKQDRKNRENQIRKIVEESCKLESLCQAPYEGHEVKARGARGSVVFQDWPYTLEIPVDLLKDGSINASAKFLFVIYRLLHREGSILNKQAAKEFLGCSWQYVKKLRGDLERAGWVRLIEPGKRFPDGVLILNDRKRLQKKRVKKIEEAK